jgi:hypothetical protein
LVEAGGIGTREVAETGATFTMTETGTHEVGRRKAGGDGNRMIGIVEIAGTRTWPGTFVMTAK